MLEIHAVRVTEKCQDQEEKPGVVFLNPAALKQVKRCPYWQCQYRITYAN